MCQAKVFQDGQDKVGAHYKTSDKFLSREREKGAGVDSVFHLLDDDWPGRPVTLLFPKKIKTGRIYKKKRARKRHPTHVLFLLASQFPGQHRHSSGAIKITQKTFFLKEE